MRRFRVLFVFVFIATTSIGAHNKYKHSIIGAAIE